MNIKLIKDLDFAAKLAISEPLTESAQDVAKRYRGYLYTNDCNCALVNNFIREARNYAYDKGMNAILESVESFIAANPISWKLATACESVASQNSTYGYLAKIGIDKAQQLLEMKEADIVAYIKAGALKGVKFIPEFREIGKDVYHSQVSESVQTVKYEMTTPFSYELVSEAGEHFVSILGKTYSITEAAVKEAVCEDEKFNKVNAHLQYFNLVGEALEYKFGDYKFTLNENKCALSNKDKQLNEFENVSEMLKYCDTLSRAIPYNNGTQFMNICGAVAEVFENLNGVVMVDQARVFRNANNTYAVVIEANDNVLVNANGVISEKKFMIEACEAIKENCGTDVKFVYENRINEDVKKGNPEQYAAIQEELKRSKDAQAQMRYEKIASLAESLKDDPAAIAVLNTLTKELRVLESQE